MFGRLALSRRRDHSLHMSDTNSLSEQSALDAVSALVTAIETGDVEGARAVYDPAVKIWHNNDGLTQTREENLKTLSELVAVSTDRRYLDIRRFAKDRGDGRATVAQQHTLRATLVNGRVLELPASLVIDVIDGRIVGLDEYFDSAAINRRT